jgi:hypothetical protein
VEGPDPEAPRRRRRGSSRGQLPVARSKYCVLGIDGILDGPAEILGPRSWTRKLKPVCDTSQSPIQI